MHTLKITNLLKIINLMYALCYVFLYLKFIIKI